MLNLSTVFTMTEEALILFTTIYRHIQWFLLATSFYDTHLYKQNKFISKILIDYNFVFRVEHDDYVYYIAL